MTNPNETYKPNPDAAIQQTLETEQPMHKPKEYLVIQTIIPQLFEIVQKDYKKSKTIQTTQKQDETTRVRTDLSLERLLKQTINSHFPNDVILGEELSPDVPKSAERIWALDPLCGSFNFASAIPFSVTNITLFEHNQPKFALAVDYANHTFYWASQKNAGVFQEERLIKPSTLPEAKRMINVDFGNIVNKPTPNRVERISAFANIVHDLIEAEFELVNFYSSLSATYAALGKRAAFMIPGTNSWDLAAACYFTEKNGGTATAFSGEPFGIHSTNAVGSLDKNLHQSLLTIIQTHWPS